MPDKVVKALLPGVQEVCLLEEPSLALGGADEVSPLVAVPLVELQ